MKRTTNKYRVLGLPYTETKDYELVIEDVVDHGIPSGRSTMYALRNKITNVIELRGNQLPLAVVVMQNQQQAFDKVLTGEMNGYASQQGLVTQPPGTEEL